MTLARSSLAPQRWALLSARLEELLELDAGEREARLGQWRRADPDLIGELEDLLATLPAVEAEGFLEGGPIAGMKAAGVHAGMVCGAWTLERVLGEGGMGSVWLARRSDGRYEGQAAIKLPHPAVLARGGAERFEREGRMLARVSHPHIAALLDAGVAASGQPYLVIEYVQGEAIDRYCDGRRLGVAGRVRLFQDVLSAVAHAHGQLVLHRDLKPSNILVDASGRVKLLDFGIARLVEGELTDLRASAQTVRAFTPDHVSPEQLQGAPAGMAADVYALGVLLYQLLSGAHPTAQPSHTPVERLRAVVEAVPLPLSEAALRSGSEAGALRSSTPQQLARLLRGDLETIVAKALKKDPAQRYPGAAALADDLGRWASGRPVLAQPDKPGYRMRLFVRRHRMGVGSALAGTVLLLAGAAATAWQAWAASRERDEARWQAERAVARSHLYNLLLGQMGGLDAPLTQRQILDRAVQLVEQRYGAQPRLAIELLLPIAGQYHTLGDVRADLDVMQRAARLAATSGDAELIASTACSTVDTYIALDRRADAQAALATARAAMARLTEPPPVLQATCWRYEAELALVQDDRRHALDAGTRAQRRLEASGQTDNNVYTALLGLMIHVHRTNGDLPGAMATAERLYELHRSQARGQSLDAAMVQRSRAVLLAESGEVAQGLALLRELVERIGRGGDVAPLPMLLTLAGLELAGGSRAKAESLLVRAEATGLAFGSTEFSSRIAYLRALIALEEGDARRASRWLATAEQIPGAQWLTAKSSYFPSPGVTRARLMLADGHAAAALAAIEAELARLDQADVANLALRADAWRAASAIALAAGDGARAQAHALAALDVALRAARDPAASSHVGHARLLLARAAQASGDSAGARAQARQAAVALERGLGADHRLTAEARSLGSSPQV